MAHYNYLTDLIPGEDWQKLTTAVALGTVLLVTGAALAMRIRKSTDPEELVVPARTPSVFGIFDLFMESFISFYDSVLGRENRRYLSFTCAVFFFVFFSNLLGLIPGMPALTTNIWVNVGLAACVFIYFNVHGVRENGVFGYLRHFAGPSIPGVIGWVLPPLIFALEIFSTCLRILTLNLRLYWNITADHTVLDVFINLTHYVVPVFFYFMGAFVAFMQAFVFTILTMIYLLLATQHAEEAHH